MGVRRKPRLNPTGTPCVSELHAVFATLDVARFEAALTAWVRAAGFDDLDERVVHLASKRLRGSQGHQLPGAHLLAVYSGELQAVVAQPAVADTNEHKTALEVLKVLPRGGLILTATRRSPNGTCATPSWPGAVTTCCRSRTINRP